MHLPLPALAVPRSTRGDARSGRLSRLENFGSNPGALNAWSFAPEGKAKGLVVVLHGCTQTAAGYDSGSGWSKLAEDYGFAVLFPEQRRTNNPNVCFNWFEPGDTRRGAGEAASIAQMIGAVIERHGIDPRRVFITGLSAGGAMTSVMLAAYPELFAGGAILAGLPHGAAASIPEAFQQMRAPSPSNRTSGQAIKSASPHPGPWPTVAIWHGTADTVVSPSNAGAILGQWQEVHGLDSDPSEEREVDGHPYRAWRDGAGKVVLEEYRVKGMGHGTPLATGGECGCGEAGAFMLEAGISATVHSAKSWGLLDKRAKAQARPATRASVAAAVQAVPDRRPAPEDRITRVIEDALRAAGLMK